jgi:sulfate adenylyltransferase
VIKPHGADALKPLLVSDEHVKSELLAEANDLPSFVVSSAAAANLVMLGGGYFTPLSGFMNLAEALSVAETMHTPDGLFWPVPVLNLIDDVAAIEGARRIALRDSNMAGNPVLAVMEVEQIEEVTPQQIDFMAEQVFGTLDDKHPGAQVFRNLGNYCVSGDVQVLNLSYFENDFPGTFRTAVQIRDEPMHRAHEELCRMAMERLGADGLVIHMLLGKLKEGDIPADVRDACIRKMVDLYFPENTVMVCGYGFDMLYAGPREAVLHAVFRQNMGATHLIVGRDHAGVGDFYGPFDAQSIFEEQVPHDALEIEIFNADHTAYSKKLNRVVMMKEAPDHTPEDYVLLSGTRMREMLGQGIAPPPELSRPEVAKILMDYYQLEEAS